jgi:hypothetical protein
MSHGVTDQMPATKEMAAELLTVLDVHAEAIAARRLKSAYIATFEALTSPPS